MLEEVLDRGGIGVVYKARDLLRQSADAGSVPIALKVLREDLRAEPQLLKSLQREALQSQGLSHPNIVRVHDFHQDGETPFLTMELLDGELLRTVLAKYRPAAMPRERAMRIIEGMCHGLAHAHAHGIVHGDFKPGNVFLTARDEAKILDFGLASATATADGRAGNALLIVSPAYASCNRLDGGVPAFSDDVYSLSCVIYELLAGRHPFDRKSGHIVRDRKLQPKRIAGLTRFQWRALSAGLQPSREECTTEIHDLQVAFSAPALTVRPAVGKKGRLSGVVLFSASGLLLGAAVLAALAFMGVAPIPAKYTKLVQESELGRRLQPVLDWRSTEAIESEFDMPTQPALSGDRALTAANGDTAALPKGEEATDADTPIGDVAAVAADTSPQIPEDPVASAAGGMATSREAPGPAPLLEDAAATPVAGAPGFHLDSPVYTVQENAVALAVSISRQGDLATRASVEWTIYAGSADPQSDYAEPDNRLLRFAAGENTKTIFIPIVADNVPERAETFQLALRSSGGNAVLAEPMTAMVTIIDDDTRVPFSSR